jgi:DNA-binding XRE family transcriptional regulator
MYDNRIFGQRLSELRKKCWNLYKANQDKRINPYKKYACCKTQETLADALGVERRTIGKWEQGTSKPTIDKVTELCNLLECNIDYLFVENVLIEFGYSHSKIASQYSGISVDIINYAQRNSAYLDFLNYFMLPDNCFSLVDSVELTAGKDFLIKSDIKDILDPLKSIIIDTFQHYIAFTSFNNYCKEKYKEYILSALPASKISFSHRKLNDCICISSCISKELLNEHDISEKNTNSYQLFINFIVDYSYEKLMNKVFLDIQKENLGKSFVRLFEKYLSD